MRLIVDTHIFVWSVQDRARLAGKLAQALTDADEVNLSVVSIWETNIKNQLGKLPLLGTLDQAVDRFLRGGAAAVLPLTRFHAATLLPDPPATNDPFDRLLLAQCEIEGMKLVTVDKNLRGHRLAAAL